ncbi:peptidase U32 family protein [Vibrio salinus]|uniref:peptidase U32 family protein n=1 Tax=Vibrio salinus TaxID=2899784 RepID=UPI001E3BAA64|nr:peptidase U32 family protein [Vibrio salinus]MCE0492473.1 U32 family peptidase [Vibrio salinus]
MTNHNTFELLAPGGDIDSIKAAIAAGADAVYCGLDRFNARNRATNLSLESLKTILELAHQNHCKIFITLNIIILESEFPALFRLVNQLVNTSVDGVIIQDLGLGYLLKHHFPMLEVHASTQMNTHNEGQILFAKKLGVHRINLSRELSIKEIKPLTEFGRQNDVLMEVFIHGSYCIGFSGHCYMSSARNGASGNRGRCSQPCRDTYQQTAVGISHPLNLKDNCAYHELDLLKAAGVYSLKIEGRMKKPHYVYTTVKQWRQQIDHFETTGNLLTDISRFYSVFNRDFSTGFLDSHVGKNMFIDNSRDHSADYLMKQQSVDLQAAKQIVYDNRTSIIHDMDKDIKQLVNLANESEPQVTEANDSGKRNKIAHQPLPQIEPPQDSVENRHLSVLISNPEDISALKGGDADLLYELPASFARQLDHLVSLFCENRSLVPWFPSILIGENYAAAAQFLHEIPPRTIVTNNSGIAILAEKMGFHWIAGPEMNITNSYALLCLNKEFGAKGAFISNEINALQMRKIKRPDNFRLYHSIFHPITLMTSRQCLFQQTTGCRKSRMNKGCLPNCDKHTSILNLKNDSFVIHKQKGHFNCVYGNKHFLNTDISTDLPDLFTDYLIDLRDVKTDTKSVLNKRELVAKFKKWMNGDEKSEVIHQVIQNTVNNQYLKGL